MITVSIADQTLYQRRKTGVWYAYPVSTAEAGVGNMRGSLMTPLGRHRICARIGDGLPIYTVFRGRRPVGIYDPAHDNPARDWILTRILWLEGMQTGVNRRGRVDTKSRFIYIHGTHAEDRIGVPASHGCIRMRNPDMMDLFEHSHVGETVRIVQSLPFVRMEGSR